MQLALPSPAAHEARLSPGSTGPHAGLLQGLWWLPAAGEALGAGPTAGSAAAAAAAAAGDAELLRLAAAARMNTDVRRAVFCCVMGAEDASDAFERLLRLGLKVRQSPGHRSAQPGAGAKGIVQYTRASWERFVEAAWRHACVGSCMMR
jgi:hypothetical protein